MLEKQNPIIHVRIKMSQFTEDYRFECDDSQKIVLRLILPEFLGVMDLLKGDSATAEFVLCQEEFHSYLRVTSKITSGVHGDFRTEIPVTLIPSKKSYLYEVPKELPYNRAFKAPRFPILRKYLELHKPYKHVVFCLKNGIFILESKETDSKVMTSFPKDENYDMGTLPSDNRLKVNLESKKVISYFSSLTLLHAINMTDFFLYINHLKALKVFFKTPDKALKFDCVLPGIESEYLSSDEDEVDNNENNDSENGENEII